jgi:hypothetical protein
MNYGKAKLSKNDFLEDMNATYDKEYAEWLLSEIERIIRNRYIIYVISDLIFTIAFFYSYFALTYGIETILYGMELRAGHFISYMIIFSIGSVYCLLKIIKTIQFRKDRDEMRIIFERKYSEPLQEQIKKPITTPEDLSAAKSQYGRAVLRSKSKEEAENIIDNEKIWDTPETYTMLIVFYISILMGGGLIIFAALYIIYKIYAIGKKWKEVENAKKLINEKFD